MKFLGILLACCMLLNPALAFPASRPADDQDLPAVRREEDSDRAGEGPVPQSEPLVSKTRTETAEDQTAEKDSPAVETDNENEANESGSPRKEAEAKQEAVEDTREVKDDTDQAKDEKVMEPAEREVEEKNGSEKRPAEVDARDVPDVREEAEHISDAKGPVEAVRTSQEQSKDSEGAKEEKVEGPEASSQTSADDEEPETVKNDGGKGDIVNEEVAKEKENSKEETLTDNKPEAAVDNGIAAEDPKTVAKPEITDEGAKREGEPATNPDEAVEAALVKAGGQQEAATEAGVREAGKVQEDAVSVAEERRETSVPKGGADREPELNNELEATKEIQPEASKAPAGIQKEEQERESVQDASKQQPKAVAEAPQKPVEEMPFVQAAPVVPLRSEPEPPHALEMPKTVLDVPVVEITPAVLKAPPAEAKQGRDAALEPQISRRSAQDPALAAALQAAVSPIPAPPISGSPAPTPAAGVASPAPTATPQGRKEDEKKILFGDPSGDIRPRLGANSTHLPIHAPQGPNSPDSISQLTSAEPIPKGTEPTILHFPDPSVILGHPEIKKVIDAHRKNAKGNQVTSIVVTIKPGEGGELPEEIIVEEIEVRGLINSSSCVAPKTFDPKAKSCITVRTFN